MYNNNMELNTKYKKIKEIDLKDDRVQHILKQYEISDRKINKYFYGKKLEVELIEDFLEENKIKFIDFISLLLFRDGAISDEMAIASLHHLKRMSSEFLEDRNFTFNCKNKEKYTNLDAYKESEKSYKSLKLRLVMAIEIDVHWAQKGFFTFQQYIKSLMNDFGLYPDGWYEEMVKDSETNYDRSKTIKKELNEDETDIYYASFTVSSFEKQKIMIPFNDFLHKKGLNISKLIRYWMWKLNLIDFETAKLDHTDKDKILRLKDNKPYSKNLGYNSMKEMESQIDKKARETVVVLIPDDRELKEKLKGKMGTFVKYVLNQYNVYPKFGEEPYNRSFKLFQNQKKLGDLEELLKKPQES
jgi:hypothetical protein